MESRMVKLRLFEGDICRDGSEYTRISDIIFTGTDSLTEEALLTNLKEAQDSLSFKLSDFLNEYEFISDRDLEMARELKSNGFFNYGTDGFGNYQYDSSFSKFDLVVFSGFYFPALIANMCIMGTAGRINLENGAGYFVDKVYGWSKRSLMGKRTKLNDAIYGGYSTINYVGARSWENAIGMNLKP